ncbi:MAG: hypothetical protein RR295_04180 [Oscillospiraceae bacterium]
MGNQNLREKLNQLGAQWNAAQTPGNEAVRQAVEFEIWNLVFQIYDRPEQADQLGEMWEREWPKFDPDKGSLTSFLDYRFKMRERDQQRSNARAAEKCGSLDAKISGDGENEITGGEFLADAPAEDAFLLQERLDAEAFGWTALILGLPRRLQGRANNPIRLNYFRMFFTDSFSNFLRKEAEPTRYVAHERDAFQAMKLPFLDYFMDRPYRAILELAEGHLKSYGDLVDGRPMTEAKQPLANDVFIAYLGRLESYQANASAVTQQRQEYRKFMKEILC